MDFKLKSILRSGIPEAISKVERYRLLNKPEEAESICHDILAVEPEHQMTLRLLGLTITDQFSGRPTDRYADAETAFRRLTDAYERLYYAGILYERRAKAQLGAGRPPHIVLALFEKALEHFEGAEAIRPEGNDDAILRWNGCVRLLQSRLGSEWRKEMEALEAGDSPPI